MISSWSGRRQVAEVVAVAGHADDEVAVLFGVRLRVAQGRGGHDVELDVVAAQREVRAHEADEAIEVRVGRPALPARTSGSGACRRCACDRYVPPSAARQSAPAGPFPGPGRCRPTPARARAARRRSHRPSSRNTRGRSSRGSSRGSVPPRAFGGALDGVVDRFEDRREKVVSPLVVVAVARRLVPERGAQRLVVRRSRPRAPRQDTRAPRCVARTRGSGSPTGCR